MILRIFMPSCSSEICKPENEMQKAIWNFTSLDSLKESCKELTYRNVTHALHIYHYGVQNEHTNVDLEIQVEVSFSL